MRQVLLLRECFGSNCLVCLASSLTVASEVYGKRGLTMGIDKSTIHSTVADELRKRAEDMLMSKVADVMSTRNKHDTKRLLHELQVHQVELEMQNEELLRVNAELSECSKLNCNIILSLSAHIAVQLWEKPACGVDRETNPDFTLGSVGYQQTLRDQLAEYVSTGPLFQA